MIRAGRLVVAAGEIKEVLTAIGSLAGGNRRMALATIVEVRGSTYRRPGARLLVPEEGDSVGNLSGGCLEGEVEAVARWVMDEGRPRLVDYDLTADDEVVWGWGLGCNGAIRVFVEPADNALEMAAVLREAVERRWALAAVTVVDSDNPRVPPGARLLLREGGETRGTLGDARADREVIAAATRALEAGISQMERLHGIEVFIEVVEPPPRMLVCGAGHDSIPVVDAAGRLGWHVVVVDDRPEFLNESRFPYASEFVEAAPASAAATAGTDTRTVVVVMSHNYLRDRDYLRSFLGSGIAYLGMLGPRARLQRLLDDLASEGVAPASGELVHVHGPAGLDIGAEGPEEIAVAIVAEVMAVLHGRRAGFLRDRSGPIHERTQAAGAA